MKSILNMKALYDFRAIQGERNPETARAIHKTSPGGSIPCLSEYAYGLNVRSDNGLLAQI